MTTRTITKPVSPMVTFFSGQTILLNSAWTSCRKVRIPAGENEDLRSDSGVSFFDSPPDLLARDCFFVDITCLAWTRRAHLKGTNQWQARRDSNPQPPDLESGALPFELLACLLRFFVRCMRLAERAVLFQLQLVWNRLFVLGGRIVALLAALASQRYIISHDYPPEQQQPGQARLLIFLRLYPWVPGRDAYSIISLTTPAPTVRPPSRMAKRSPASMAIGVISSPVM